MPTSASRSAIDCSVACRMFVLAPWPRTSRCVASSGRTSTAETSPFSGVARNFSSLSKARLPSAWTVARTTPRPCSAPPTRRTLSAISSSCTRLPRAWSPSSSGGPAIRGRNPRQAKGRTFRSRIGRLLARLRGVPPPYPLAGVREELLLGVTDAVPCPAAEEVMILVVLSLQHFGHAVVGLDPVVHPVPHHVGIQQIRVADREEDPDRLLRAVGDERLVKAPGPVRVLRVERPRLVHERARGRQHPVIEVVAEPGHDEGRRAAGAVPHRRAAVGVLRQLHPAVLLHPRQDLGLDVLGVVAVHVVVFLAALVALGVAAAVADGDEDDRRDPLLVDQVVEDRPVAVGLAGAVLDPHDRPLAPRLFSGG